MKAQEELQKILTYEALIESKTEELIRLDSLAKKVTAAMDGEAVSGSKNLDPMGTVIVSKDNLRQEIIKLQETYVKHSEFLRNIIDGLNKPVYIKILYGVYFHGKDLTDVSDEINYSYRHTQNLHDSALQAVQNFLDKIESFHSIS